MTEICLDELKRHKIIAIIRGIAPEPCIRLVGALREGGIRMAEVTFDQNSKDYGQTTQAIRQLIRTFPDMYFGAGTVMSPEQAEAAREAGALFIVSPNTCRAVIRRTKELGMMSLPGGMTPSEIAAAYEMGADAVKVFPSDDLGPGYIKAIRAPLSHIPLIAVGGINEKNIGDYFRAGVTGIGAGGKLVNAQWVREGAFDKITALAAEFIAACARGGAE